MNTIVPPIATMSSRSSDRSCSTSTRSTITCVKTGSTICSTLTTSARPSARISSGVYGLTIGHSHARPRAASRRLLERRRVVEERRVAGPSPIELVARQPAKSERGIRETHEASRDVVQHQPVIAVPVADRRQRHAIEILRRRLDRARGEAQLLGRAAERTQARAVETGVDQLPDARERHRRGRSAC